LLPKHSVLKNLPKLPIIQLKFRVKSTKHSSQFERTRSFVFGKIYKFNTKLRDFHKIYKFNTKLRDFHRNISGIGTRWPCHISSSFFRSNRLVRWYLLLTLSPKSPGFKPQTGQKIRTKNQSSTRRSESNFSRIQSGINNRNFGPEFSA
jgi:hypothetical protein